MRRTDSKEDAYLKNLFMKIGKKIHLLMCCRFHLLTTIIHFKWSTVTHPTYIISSQSFPYPQLASKPEQVTICKQSLCQKSILHMAWGALENSLKNQGKADTIQNRKFLVMERSLNLTVYSRKAKEAPCFPEKR